jgi:hypothetical protein
LGNSSGNTLHLVSTANETDEVTNFDVRRFWVVDAASVAEA